MTSWRAQRVVFTRTHTAVLTVCLAGYIGSASLLEAVLTVLKRLRAVNPGLTYGAAPLKPCPSFAVHASRALALLPIYNR